MTDMNHMRHLAPVAAEDIRELERKEQSYRGSWKRRGGEGAFHVFARCWDRLEGALKARGDNDVFAAIAEAPSGEDGTPLASLRDLRRYLLLVEAEMVARGVVAIEAATACRPEEGCGPVAPQAGQRAQDLLRALSAEEALALDAEQRALRAERRCGEYAELTLDVLRFLRGKQVEPRVIADLVRRAECLAVPREARGL